MNKFISALVIIIVFLSLALDFMGAKLIRESYAAGTQIDIYGIYFLCTFFTVISVIAFFVQFDVIDFRISPRRFALAFRCFKSYYTKEKLRSTGILHSIVYSFQASHYFFLKSYKA